jgi:hypothetical protein
MGKSILAPNQIEQIRQIRHQCAIGCSELYLLGSQAGRASPDLEAMIYEAAEHVSAARRILEQATLLAGADREPPP